MVVGTRFFVTIIGSGGRGHDAGPLTTTIRILPDGVLLEIFRFNVDGPQTHEIRRLIRVP